jgi:4-amino-4-deoxy-L-arabinose transferase-like glycosyltransferase
MRLGVVLIYLLARRLWGQRVGLIAGLLFALDPFAAGLSGLLHVDGLLTTFSVLSILAMLNGLNRSSPLPSSLKSRAVGSEGWFALAGAFAGLAFLSKSPGLFLTGFAVVVMFLPSSRGARRCCSLLCFCHSSLSSGLVIALSGSVGTADRDAGASGLASFGANAVRPTFFDGQYQLNHGANFYLAGAGLPLDAGAGVRPRSWR